MGQSSSFWCNMRILIIVSSLLFSLGSCAKVDTCIMCTSDSGSSVPCERNPEGQVPSGQCSAEFGNDFCYVLVTRNSLSRNICGTGDVALLSQAALFAQLTRQIMSQMTIMKCGEQNVTPTTATAWTPGQTVEEVMDLKAAL